MVSDVGCCSTLVAAALCSRLPSARPLPPLRGPTRLRRPATDHPARARLKLLSGDAVKLHFNVESPEPVDAQARWTFSVDQRVVTRGEVPLPLRPGRPAEVTLNFKAAAVKEGVVLAGRVSIIVIRPGLGPP